jgi:hypothetical protein
MRFDERPVRRPSDEIEGNAWVLSEKLRLRRELDREIDDIIICNRVGRRYIGLSEGRKEQMPYSAEMRRYSVDNEEKCNNWFVEDRK